MPEGKEKTPEEKREEMRQHQLAILGSTASDLYVAGASRDARKYGDFGVDAGYQGKYIPALASGDPIVGQILATSMLASESKAGKPYGGNVTAEELLANAEKFVESAVDGVYVGDILNQMGVKEGEYGEMASYTGMTLSELKEADKVKYESLKKTYLGLRQEAGVGEAMTRFAGMRAGKSLDKLLKKEESSEGDK